MANQYTYTKICKSCKKELPVENFYFKNKQKNRRDTTCKDCKRKALRDGYDPHVASERHLQRNYGIGVDDRTRMYEEQKGVCKICGSPGDGRWKRLCIDHDHATGVVRDLLCRRCNTILGEAYDDPILLNKMSDYLNRWKERQVPQE
jgi:hypothetical protein